MDANDLKSEEPLQDITISAGVDEPRYANDLKCEEPPPREEPYVKPVNGVQPPVVPPSGRHTNHLKYIQKHIVNPALRFLVRYWYPFFQLVDADLLNLPDYHTVIKRPMDFSTIAKRLENYDYWCAEECMADFNTMFSNCYTYNQPSEDVIVMCEQFEKFILSKMAKLAKEEIEIEIPSRVSKKPPKYRIQMSFDYITFADTVEAYLSDKYVPTNQRKLMDYELIRMKALVDGRPPPSLSLSVNLDLDDLARDEDFKNILSRELFASNVRSSILKIFPKFADLNLSVPLIEYQKSEAKILAYAANVSIEYFKLWGLC